MSFLTVGRRRFFETTRTPDPAQINLLGRFGTVLDISETPTVDPFPHLARYDIGGDRRMDQDTWLDKAKIFRFVIDAPWNGWQSGKERNHAQVAQELHTRSTVGTELYSYILVETVHKSFATPGEANHALYLTLNANTLWAYQNGLTEAGQVDYDANYFQNNHATTGKVVGGKRSYQHAADFYLSWLVEGATVTNGLQNLANAANPYLDGIFIDNVFPYFKVASGNISADMDRNGVADNFSSAASQQLAQTSQVALIDYIKSRLPGKKVLGNIAEWYLATDISLLEGKLHGGVIEGGIGQSYSPETHTSFQAFINMINTTMDALLEPKWGLVVNILDSLTNYSLMRYQFAATALTNAYFHTSLSGLQTENLTIYDEYGFNLGQPIDPVQTAPRYLANIDGAGSGIWRRDFEHGIVLCAARRATFANLTAYASVSLGGTFYRITGSQDPTTNSGAAVQNIAMVPRTGLVLSRTSQDDTAPTQPGTPVLTVISSSRIDITWTASTDSGGAGLGGYGLDRAPESSPGSGLPGTWVQIAVQPGTTYSNTTGLSPSTKYFYRVVAFDNATPPNVGIYSGIASATTNAVDGQIILSDTFVSGDKSYVHPVTGARWHDNGTSAAVVADPGNASGFALQMRFNTVWSEQRFYLGAAATAGAYKELWVKMRMVYPPNYATPGGLPGNEGTNNKFFRVWHGDVTDGNDGYGGQNKPYIVKGGFSTIASNSISGIRREWGSSVDGVGPQGSPDINGFITNADLGNELTIVMHIKLDTIGTPGLTHNPPNAGNGEVAIWKNGVLFARVANIHWRSATGTGEFFEYGYVQGYANSHFAQQTDILIRELTIATGNVFGVS